MSGHTPKIWVGSLSDYNAGTLLGKWIDADQEVEEIQEEINAMLATSKEAVAEEWGIFDTDNFEGIKIDQYESLFKVAAIGELLTEFPYGVVGAVLSNGSANCALDQMDNKDDFVGAFKAYMDAAYLGSFASWEDFGADELENTGELANLPEHLEYYFDYAAYARDRRLNGDVWAHETPNEIHVFNCYA
jgi:antirestriction protein